MDASEDQDFHFNLKIVLVLVIRVLVVLSSVASSFVVRTVSLRLGGAVEVFGLSRSFVFFRCVFPILIVVRLSFLFLSPSINT